jgi:triacylglycerol lipase
MDWIRDTIGIGRLEPAVKTCYPSTASHSSLWPMQHMSRALFSSSASNATRERHAVAEIILQRLLAPFDAPAYSNLTTDYLTQHFNPSTPNDPNVQYYSYGASMEEQGGFSPLRFPWCGVYSIP